MLIRILNFSLKVARMMMGV